jgi:glycosyltransferase involved in cell wall biosynthesis
MITESYGLEGEDYVLFLGRLVPEKRVDWLIQAFHRISHPLRLVIAGDDDGEEGYARYLHDLAKGDSRVLFTGTVGGQMKEELLSNALLYATPSSLEGLPIALLEAMGHNRCCLASNIPAHKEIIAAGRNGLLFQWDDFDEFVSALGDLLARGKSYRQALGQEARCKVAEENSWEKVAEATERVYYSLFAPNCSE